jgi:hypothetical protein
MKSVGHIEEPMVPKSEHAIETGDPNETIAFILKGIEG